MPRSEDITFIEIDGKDWVFMPRTKKGRRWAKLHVDKPSFQVGKQGVYLVQRVKLVEVVRRLLNDAGLSHKTVTL